MSRGLKIEFVKGGEVRLALTGEAAGFDAVVQNCTMNFLVAQGSDPLFPNRGTDLLQRGLSGSLFSQQGARHAGNFASIDTLFFSRQHELADSADKPAEVTAENLEFAVDRLSLQPVVTSIDGRTGASTLELH